MQQVSYAACFAFCLRRLLDCTKGFFVAVTHTRVLACRLTRLVLAAARTLAKTRAQNKHSLEQRVASLSSTDNIRVNL